MHTIVDVFVEIPKGSRNKYEIDKQTGAIRLDRRLFSATSYPADYGFIPKTLAEDGDALDALVLVEEPTFPGCIISAIPIGILWMEDEKGPDAKILCVPKGDPTLGFHEDISTLPPALLAEIEHFFEAYKDLEPEKHSFTKGYEGQKAALKEISLSKNRYDQLKSI